MKVYEQSRKKRDAELKSKKQRESSEYLFENGRNRESSNFCPSVSLASINSATAAADSNLPSRRRRSLEYNVNNDESKFSRSISTSAKHSSDKSRGRGRFKIFTNNTTGSEVVDPDFSVMSCLDEVEEQEDALSFERAHCPGFDLLTPLEADFCSRSALLPLHYLAAKEAIVRLDMCYQFVQLSDLYVIGKSIAMVC